MAAVSLDLVHRAAAGGSLTMLSSDVLTIVERDLLRTLVQDKSSEVQQQSLFALSQLCISDPSEALTLALLTRISGKNLISHNLFLWLVGSAESSKVLQIATDTDLCSLVEKLKIVPDLDDHWIQTFLSMAAGRVPVAIVELFLERLEDADINSGTQQFSAVPFVMHADLSSLVARPEYPDLLRRIVDKHGESTHRSELSRLFEQLSLHFSTEASQSLLSEMIRSGKPNRIADAAGLFRSAGLETFLKHRAWIVETLQNAAVAGEECLSTVKSFFWGAATAGGKSGTPGEPFPADVKLKQEAISIAETLNRGSAERAFFEELAKDAERGIAQAIEEGELLDQ